MAGAGGQDMGSTMRSSVLPAARGCLLVAAVVIGAAAGEVQSIAVVRGLPLAEAAQGQVVRIRGVVTVRPRDYVPTEAAIVQDDTGGVWVSLERLTVIPEELERGCAVGDAQQLLGPRDHVHRRRLPEPLGSGH